MSKFGMQMRFVDDAERERYWRLRPNPAMADKTAIGVAHARHDVCPTIAAHSRNGLIRNLQTDALISVQAMIDEFLISGLADQTTTLGRDLTDDERFMYGVGFISATAETTAQAPRVQAGGEKLGEAFAFMEARRIALAQANELLGAPLAAPVAHALSHASKRPLRPEDFGALPSGP